MVEAKELNSRNLIIVFVILFLLGLATYFNSFQNKFLMDDFYFKATPLYSDIQYTSLQWNPYREQVMGIYDPSSSNQNIYFRPFAHVEISICYALFKDTYWKYHLFNLIMFVVAVFFLFLCIVQISKNFTLAFLASALYLVHPINGLIVNYITASCFAFQVIFMAGSVLLLFLSVEKLNNRFYYYTSLLFFTLALLCHESAVMTPFYIAVALISTGCIRLNKILSYMAPFLLVLFCFILFRFMFVQQHEILLENSFSSSLNIFKYIATVFILLFWYVSKLFVPNGITLMFLVQDIKAYSFWYNFGFFSAVFLCISLYFRFKENKTKLIALLWFLIGFTPCFVATFMIYNQTARIEPHWFVFSSIGFFIFFAYFLLFLLDRLKRWLGWVVICIVFLLLIQASHVYNNRWKDEVTYMKYWLSIYPNNLFAQETLAHAYMLEGSYAEAEDLKLSQLKYNSKNYEAYRDLAIITFNQGNMLKAEMYTNLALKLRPSCVDCYLKLADISFEKNDFISGEKYLLKASSLDPSNLDVDFRMIYLYTKNKNTRLIDLSQNYLNKVESSQLLLPFAILMAQNNLNDLAYQAYQKALRVNPHDKYIYLGIATFLGNQGMYDEAIKMCHYGLKVDPQEVHFKEIIEKAIKQKNLKINSN